MKFKKTFYLSALAFPTILCGSASAAVLASTSFDGRTLPSPNTASTLNWTTNGLDDPGDMAAFNATPGAQALFDGNALVQNMFAPGINTGNGNTFWTTSVNLTVSGGSTVSLTDVTFDYWSINGGQTQNVERRSDFTVSLLSPTAVILASVDVVDANSGSTIGIPTVTAAFASAIPLTLAGTYTLAIKGGDFAGLDETGNHTGIDNLSINGTIGAVPEPSAIMLSVLGLLTLASRRRRES